MSDRKSNIIIISAPSGAGKSTLIQRLLTEVPELSFSISHTTRSPRQGEQNGVEYFFVSKPEFQDMIRNSQFLEWAEVHGHCYGTSRGMLETAIHQAKDLVLDIDIQGARSVRQVLPEAISIFILPPTNETLKQRLESRQKDSEEQIARRIQNAYNEIQCWQEFDYIIINSDLDDAFENLAAVVRSIRCKRERIEEKITKIVKTFHL